MTTFENGTGWSVPAITQVVPKINHQESEPVWEKYVEKLFESLDNIEVLLKNNLLKKGDSVNEVSVPRTVNDPKYPWWTKQENYKIKLPDLDQTNWKLQWWIEISKNWEYWKKIIVMIWKDSQKNMTTVSIQAHANVWMDWVLLAAVKSDTIDIKSWSNSPLKDTLLKRVLLIFKQLEKLPEQRNQKSIESAQNNLAENFSDF
jgi:hypothetical protein